LVPALEGAFIERATMDFLSRNPNVYCSIHSGHSRWITESILERQVDVGLVTSRIDNPAIITEPLLEHPLVCIMPPDHPLARLDVVRPEHLDRIPFVSFNLDSYTWQKIASIFKQHDVNPNVVLNANASSSVCEFVAAGLGVSLVHPLFTAGVEARVVVRPFEPATPFDFLFCYARDARNSPLILDFVRATKKIAEQISEALP
jgi:DNA-binding transcriptional LysR family regulator